MTGALISCAAQPQSTDPLDLKSIRKALGLDGLARDALVYALPFSAGDLTAGAENEFQSAVRGPASAVDLAQSINESSYYQSIQRRYAAGETSRTIVNELEAYLSQNSDQIWENSWVRFKYDRLSPYSQRMLATDLLIDKRDPFQGTRSDAERFVFEQGGEKTVRVPVSYLLKVALAQALSPSTPTRWAVRLIGESFMKYFLNDNTSPEISTFNPVPLRPEAGLGREIARETLLRNLLTQLLVAYANRNLGLLETDQEVQVYHSPHPPIRQKYLNECVSDAFYRELFMNPCLSGWDRGEDKYHYMHLCHQVLSRSQLNTITKLKEAGIITRNLVVLPNMSNISLANNGTHITMGSRKLTGLLQNPASGFSTAAEKHLGDLAIKITEHFLPLFVGTYTAAPYRMDFVDFHPEKALGFLAHELQYTHLRMIWRRWLKKARFKVMGQPFTPLGPLALDKSIAALFRFKGDYIHDFRLLDYLVALMSTENCPALDGQPDNSARLKRELSSQGVFDERMSLYLLFKQRDFATMGFAGFEGRYYSLFRNIETDMGSAASLQALITALAYKYILSGDVTHAHIPDEVFVESERRQIFFGTAIGIPTFFVRKNTSNAFLLKIIAKTPSTRSSSRYPGYLRVHNHEYRKALLQIIREDAPELVENLGLAATLRDLELRLDQPRICSVAGLLTSDILKPLGKKDPMQVKAADFNRAAETYYRTTLRKSHLRESIAALEQACRKIEGRGQAAANAMIREVLDGQSSLDFLELTSRDLIEDKLPEEMLLRLIHLTLIVIDNETGTLAAEITGEKDAASVH